MPDEPESVDPIEPGQFPDWLEIARGCVSEHDWIEIVQAAVTEAKLTGPNGQKARDFLASFVLPKEKPDASEKHFRTIKFVLVKPQ